MAIRPWQGPIVLEGVQTGDGRIFLDGSFTWADLPLPLAWIVEGDQHVDLVAEAPQIGTIDTIERRDGGIIWATGGIDDETEEGAEVVRRMEAGTAPLGVRFPVSVDPDDWTLEVVDTNPSDDEDEELLLVASGATYPFVSGARLLAAAGEGDPEGEVLMEDAADAIVLRFTAGRIRGATLCSVAAFDGAFIELGGVAAPAEVAPAEASVVAALADPYPPLPIPAKPPAEWFTMAEPGAGSDLLVEQPDGSWAVPLTITDDGQVFGHIARWNGAHRGLSGKVTPPRSKSGYQHFHLGLVETAEGQNFKVGALTVGGDHADLSMNMGDARDFYANSTLGWADGVMSDGEFGPWFSGACRPGLNEADLRILRSLSPSGDWRAQDGSLEFITALMVNVPGFPVTRQTLAASARLAIFGKGATIGDARPAPAACVGDACTLDMHLSGTTALVAAGMVIKCAECEQRARQESLTAAMLDDLRTQLADVHATMRRVEAYVRHMEPLALEALTARMHPPA